MVALIVLNIEDDDSGKYKEKILFFSGTLYTFAISINLGSTFKIALNIPSNCNGNITRIATNIGAWRVVNQISASRIIDIVGIVLTIDVKILLTLLTPFSIDEITANTSAIENEIIKDNNTLDNEFPTAL